VPPRVTENVTLIFNFETLRAISAIIAIKDILEFYFAPLY